jgi:hypothetical protein
MKMKYSSVSFLATLSLGLFLSGCGGMHSDYEAPNIILPPNIKSIAVKPFENQTSETGINNRLWLDVTDEFIRDGRISYEADPNKADGVVVGVITQFKETELSHDVNLVPLEYQIWAIMNLKFLDRANNQYLWEEPRIEQKFRYLVETQPGGMTREQAKEELWSLFASDIVRRTIQGFGSVTSASPRAVPQAPPADNPAPSYPATNPY